MIQENVSLKAYNTFGMDVKARWFAVVSTLDELLVLIRDEQFSDVPKFILGGGSNVLFTGDVDALVIKNSIRGISRQREDEEHVWVKAYSGEVWHKLVLYTLGQGLGGIENLSLIPGTVGAAPIQNIGAYGVELKDVFDSLEAVDMQTGELHTFQLGECSFGYRESFFKKEAKGRYFILSVILKLRKQPVLNTSYGAIKTTLAEMGISELTAQAVSKAVIHIRRSKLPDPAVTGNAGSFFKNPEIPEALYQTLKERYPAMPAYPVGEGRVKIPAGWLIESLGWKGRRIGETGSHKDQALVLVNYGHATGREVRQLAYDIIASVQDKYGIALTPEVNIL